MRSCVPVPEDSPFSLSQGIHILRRGVHGLSYYRTHTPLCRDRQARSCDTQISVPSKSCNACFNTSFVFMSRWLVGSSRIRRFTGSRSSLRIARRVFSPPLSTFTFLVEASPPNMNAPNKSVIFLRISPFAISSIVSNTVSSSSSNDA